VIRVPARSLQVVHVPGTKIFFDMLAQPVARRGVDLFDMTDITYMTAVPVKYGSSIECE